MLLKITPVLRNGKVGKPTPVETDSMGVECKQASHYVKGSDVFKFFVISKIQKS